MPVRTETLTVTERIRDTTVVVVPDSATATALLECDSLNRVMLSQLAATDGGRIKTSTLFQRNSDGGATLTVDCREDSLLHEIALRDTLIERIRSETRTVEVPAKLTRWQRFLMKFGSIALVAVVLLVILTIIKFLRIWKNKR